MLVSDQKLLGLVQLQLELMYTDLNRLDKLMDMKERQFYNQITHQMFPPHQL